MQIHTPTVVQGGGVDGHPLEFLICCSISKRFYLQWKAFDILYRIRYILILSRSSAENWKLARRPGFKRGLATKKKIETVTWKRGWSKHWLRFVQFLVVLTKVYFKSLLVASLATCGSRTRFWSSDLWVMGPARFHCATLLMSPRMRIINFWNKLLLTLQEIKRISVNVCFNHVFKSQFLSFSE